MPSKTTPTIPQPVGEPRIRRRFQQTNLSGNNNKYYLVEVWDIPGNAAEVYFKATYGRVEGTPQHDRRVTTERWVHGKIAEKLRTKTDGTRYVEVALAAPTAGPAAPTAALVVAASGPVQTLVAHIFKEAGEQIKTYLAGTVDALSPQQIAKGRQLIVDAQAIWAKTGQYAVAPPTLRDEVLGVTQAYYNAIPTKLPAKIDPWLVAREFCTHLDEHEDRLSQLEAALSTLSAPGSPQTQQNALGVELELLDPRDDAYRQLSHYVTSSAAHGYVPRIRQIFAVCVPQERAAYVANRRGTSHRDLLFHGTAAHNVRHILKTGLIVPKVASNGRAFGDGIYFANRSTKSTNYCSARYGDKILFITEVALGRMYTPRGSSEVSRNKAAPAGYDSLWAKAKQTDYIQYDELIVYEQPQQTIRYLITLA